MSQKYYLRTKAYGIDIPADQHEDRIIPQMLQCFTQNARVAIQSAWINKKMLAGSMVAGQKMKWPEFSKAVEDLLSTEAACRIYDPCVIYQEDASKLPPCRDGRQARTLNNTAKQEEHPTPFNARCRQCGENTHATDHCEKSKNNKLQCDVCGMKNHITALHRHGQRSQSVGAERGRDRDRDRTPYRPRANSQVSFYASNPGIETSGTEGSDLSDDQSDDSTEMENQDFC